MKPPNTRKCRNRSCRATFIPSRPLQTVCSISCSIALIDERKAKQEKAYQAQAKKQLHAETKARKEKLKSRSQWANDAQTAFNAFIRERDRGLPCISSGRFTGKMNAGHYLSRGAHPELRFHEDNCHLQSEKDNSYLSGNQAEYRHRLIEKIGLERVEWLEGPHEPKHYTIDELKAIKAEYKAKLKGLKDGI